MKNWKHIRTSEYNWDFFGDKHGRETSKVRTFNEGNQFIWEASLKPNYVAESHWHPYDIVQIFLEGEFICEGEGSFFPGDIRWVKAGQSTIEGAGSVGSRFYLIALGGDIPLMWDDLYAVPEKLANELKERGNPVGNANITISDSLTDISRSLVALSFKSFFSKNSETKGSLIGDFFALIRLILSSSISTIVTWFF